MYDVIIIGGGPAGLTAALTLARCCRRVLLIDSGAPRNARAQCIHGVLGFDGCQPADLHAKGREEVARYDVEILADTVVQADNHQAFVGQTEFSIVTHGGREESCRKLLFATGVRDVLPDIPGLDQCYGITVHHCPYCDGYEHRGKQLAALGEDAHAGVGLGLTLRTWSERVMVLTNGEVPSPSDRQRLERNGIGLALKRVAALVAEGTQLRAVRFRDGEELEIHSLFFAGQQRQQCSLAEKLGVPMKETCITSDRQKCCVPGLFIAGDADRDVQSVAVAAGEGAVAAQAINRELQDEDRGDLPLASRLLNAVLPG